MKKESLISTSKGDCTPYLTTLNHLASSSLGRTSTNVYNPDRMFGQIMDALGQDMNDISEIAKPALVLSQPETLVVRGELAKMEVGVGKAKNELLVFVKESRHVFEMT
jgi:hypothetical protein